MIRVHSFKKKKQIVLQRDNNPFPLFPIIKLTDALSNVLSPTPIAKTGRPWKEDRTRRIELRIKK